MKGAILYFSGTGNTEYVSNIIKDEFTKRGIACSLFEISKDKDFKDNYDFYVIGGPIHAELYPKIFTDFILENLTVGHKRKCIVFSTEGSKSASGPAYLGKKLIKKGFDIVVEDCFFMPNNYYLVMGKKLNKDQKIELMGRAKIQAAEVVEKFLKDEPLKRSAKGRVWMAIPASKLFLKYSRNFAYKNFSVESEKCIKCGKCIMNCPVKNIALADGRIVFGDKCISCLRCLNNCPKDAFLYKGKPFDKYDLHK